VIRVAAGTDIICFSKDWHEPKTSNHHVMETLARTHRVLWVNSIATRSPNLASGNDLKKIARKVRSWFRGVERVSANLRVITPVVLPLPGSPAAQAINRFLVLWAVHRAARRWRLIRPQLWLFLPNAVDYAGSFDESAVVYYCVDEWSQFTHINGAFIREKEDRLLRRADVVFVVSAALAESKTASSRPPHIVRHGVDHALFARALEQGFEPAPEFRGLPRPVVGFTGSLYDWVDQDLIADMARRRPDWSFVLVGKIMTDVAALRQAPNIHLLGNKPHAELPRYCRGFDVGIIPYRLGDPRMQSVNPLKLREYLASGLPVVTVDLPEARQVDADAFIAAGADGFIAAIEQAIRADSPDRRRARSDRMRSESWEARVADIERVLQATQPRGPSHSI
jgi:glycosyltransferase involved in cell wall biosynthesis